VIRFARQLDEAEPVINIGLDGEHPFCMLSFDYQHGRIPVPGFAQMFSESVTGVLEGLRLVSRRGHPGKVNFGFFVGPGRERTLRPEQWCTGYSYRGRCIDLAEARRRILIPTYLWVLSHKAGTALSKVQKRSESNDVWLFDGHASCDIKAPERLSAAAVLAAYLSGQLHQFQEGWPIFEQ
jgi:hypothetical protein